MSHQDVRTAEEILNNHARALTRVFNIGKGIGQMRRCARALISNYVTIPVLQGLRKDHKPNREGKPVLGPKMRPLCAANKAPNAAVGNLVAQIAKAVGDTTSKKIGGEVISTEDMKRRIQDLNSSLKKETSRNEAPRRSKLPPIQDKLDLEMFFMDVSAFYPSVTSEMAAKAVDKNIRLADLEWKEIDVKQLTRYVAMTIDRKKVEEEELEDVVPIPKPRTTFNSYVNPKKRSRATNGDSQFSQPTSLPNKSQLKKLIGLALGEATKATMNNHFYTINGEIRRQKEGGAIGSDATGECTRLYMLTWDKRLATKLKTMDIHVKLYTRYVDDIVCILPPINPGWTFDKEKGRMKYDKNTAETDTDNPDVRTAKTIVEIANSLEPAIQLTWDCPSRNGNGRMAVLDLEMLVHKEGGLHTVAHSFYKKALASPYTILKRSALAYSVKKSTLLQEALRRLGNTSDVVPWSEVADIMSRYNDMLKINGYSQKERFHMTKGAISRHKEMREEVRNGSRKSMFRSKEEILKAKEAKGGLTPSTWFLGGDVEAVVTCQVTPDGQLADMMRKKVGTTKAGGRRIVQEEGGNPISLGLKKRDPFAVQTCRYGDSQCLGRPGQDCGAMGALYLITCTSCKTQLPPEVHENPGEKGGVKSCHYIGMTASSCHSRWLHHREGQRRKEEGNALHRHDLDFHAGEPQSYTAKVITREISLLTLTVREAILQEYQDRTITMNDRIEMGRRGSLIRIHASGPG